MLNQMVFDIDFKDKDIYEQSMEIIKKRDKYIKLYGILNKTGQDKAIEHVEMLAKIPEYRKEED